MIGHDDSSSDDQQQKKIGKLSRNRSHSIDHSALDSGSWNPTQRRNKENNGSKLRGFF